MNWSQFVRLLDAVGFPRQRSEMWADWVWWEHFSSRSVHRHLSAEEIILAVGYVMRGRKAEAVCEIEQWDALSDEALKNFEEELE